MAFARNGNLWRQKPDQAERTHKKARTVEGAGLVKAGGPGGPRFMRLRLCVGRKHFFHLLHRGDFDLANALGADFVLGGQVMQRHAA